MDARRGTSVRAALALLLGLIAGCAASGMPAIHSEPERLAAARRALERGDAAIAVELLKTYVANNAGGADVDQAVYLLGQAYLKMRDWPSAAVEFDRVLRDYPESDSAGSSAFRLGEALWGQSRPPDFDQEHTQKALDQWQSYLRSWPGHWLNPEAARRVEAARERLATKLLNTGNLYLKLRRAGPARVYFERVIAEFGDTPQAIEARIGLALADAQEGRRELALAALDEVRQQYPGQPAARRAERERSRLEHRR